MKKEPKKYSITYKLIKVPLLFFFLAVTVFISALYFYQDSFFFTSYHQDKVFSAINEKKTVINNWFQALKKDFENSANTIKEHYKTINNNENQKLTKTQQRKSPSDKPQSEEAIKKILNDKGNKGLYNFLSVISKEGKVIASTSSDMTDRDIAETDIFKNIISKVKDTTFIGFWKEGQKEYEIDMVCPIRDEKGNVVAFLHGIVNLKSLQSIIAYEKGMFYEIVDKDGHILMASNQITKGMKYSSQFTNNIDKISLFDDKIIVLVKLRELNLYLLQKTDTYYALYPLIEVFTIILVFILFIILLFIYQTIVIKRQISSPLNRVVGFVRSSAAGIQSVKLKGRFPSEIENLLEAINDTRDDLISKNEVKEAPKKEVNKEHLNNFQAKTKIGSNLITNLKSSSDKIRLENYNIMRKLMEVNFKDENFTRLKTNLLNLIAIIENIIFFTNDDSEKREFIFSEIISEIDTISKSLNMLPSVELIIEHDDTIRDKKIVGNKKAILQIIINLLTSSLASTDNGTVTLLSSLIKDEESQSIIISIADTGNGFDQLEIEGIKSRRDNNNPALLSAYMIAQIYDIQINIDSQKGRGTTTSVLINI